MMKKENMKKKSTARKLLPAAGMLAVSASMLATSTYAWFTMSRDVQVTGLQMKTKVGSNLLISSNNGEGTYSADTLVEGRKALLEPVSSNTAQTGKFFYTLDALDSGQKAHGANSATKFNYKAYNEDTGITNGDAIVGKYSYDDDFNTAYEVSTAGTSGEYKTAYGYVDYVFYLKATSDGANDEIRMTQCDLNYDYNGASEGTGTNTGDKAWRIAVFATELTAAQAQTGNTGAVGQIDPAAIGNTAKSILALDGAVNWTSNEAVASETATGSVTYGTDAKLATGLSEGDHYFKVLVRVWLEGEDKSCNSETYATLKDTWSLDLDFQLTSNTENGAGKTAVKNISKNAWDADRTETQPAVTSPIEVVTTVVAGGGGGN